MFENQNHTMSKAQMLAHMNAGIAGADVPAARDPDLLVALRRLGNLQQQANELVEVVASRTIGLRRPEANERNRIDGPIEKISTEQRCPLATEILIHATNASDALSRVRAMIEALEA